MVGGFSYPQEEVRDPVLTSPQNGSVDGVSWRAEYSSPLVAGEPPAGWEVVVQGHDGEWRRLAGANIPDAGDLSRPGLEVFVELLMRRL